MGVAFASRNLGWAVGEAGAILATTDGGATWNTSYSAPVSLSAIACLGHKQAVAVGHEGTILSAPVR